MIAAAFVRRQLAEETVRWVPLALSMLAFAGGLFTQAYLGRMVDSSGNPALGGYQGHYTAYLLLGMALLDLQSTVAGGLSSRIREAQLSGSLETMLATPTPAGWVLFGLVLPDVLWAFARLVAYALVGAIWFGVRLGAADPLGALVTLILAMGAFSALALVSAALTMLLRRSNPLSLALASTSLIAGGVMYPRQILPAWLARIGAILPIAPALDGMRAAVVQGSGFSGLRWPLALLGGFVAIGGPAGVWLFARSLGRARADGSLTAY